MSNIDVFIFILDTGVRSTHYEFNSNTFYHLDPNFTISDILDGHGTHVASLAAGQSAGVAPGLTIYEYPVCRGADGSCGYQDLNDGYQAVVSTLNLLNSNYSYTKYRGVINLSFGTDGESTLPPWYKKAVDDDLNEIINAGGIPVAAAGNDGINECGYPAGSEYAISVGAYLQSGQIASFSNYGNEVDIFAPGNRLISAWHISDSSYALVSGTSQAAPIITGIVAQILSLDSRLDLNEIREILKSTTNTFDLSDCPYDAGGNGCKGISIECNTFINNILVPTMSPTPLPLPLPIPTNNPTNDPTNNPTQTPIAPTATPIAPYIYCCNPKGYTYTSRCWPIDNQDSCNIYSRMCEWNSTNCQYNFKCTVVHNSCSTDSECCSGDCSVSRRGKTCS